jgi:DNA modification methylase
MVIDQKITDKYALFHADCVEVARQIPADSIHYSISSWPFASLYTYSNSERDMGNCRTYDEFCEHIAFLIYEQYRITMPGRLVSIHCMNLPTSKQHHGYIGIQDFRGDIIRWMQKAGFIYHSEVLIWKDPVTAMQRTKALGLLHKQIRKDSSMSRQGIPDYLVTFRKPGENPEPVSHTHETFPVAMWQQYASPVWALTGEDNGDGFYKVYQDINPSKTLQRESAREDKDERHICPLQLEVIERGIELWSNPGDTVYDPFGGIGSTGHMALKKGRKTIMSELKASYYRQMVLNCEAAINHAEQSLLFAS